MGLNSVIETPYEIGNVVNPGLPVLPHDVERYLIPGAGSRAVLIEKGDEISVLDREGLQSAELVFFDPDGRSDAGMIGAQGRGNAKGLQVALASGGDSGKRVLKALDVEGGDVPTPGDCIRVDKAQVGDITSAMKSPYLDKVIALARIDVVYSGIGTEIEIAKLDGHQKRLRAQVVRFPHFDPTKERVKGNYD